MNFSRLIHENRPAVVLVLLLSLSLVSLATGTEAGIIHQGLNRAIALATYPILAGTRAVEDNVDYATDFVFEFNRLYEENTSLQDSLAQMHVALARQHELQRENKRLREMLQFQRNEPRLSLQPAKVLQSYKGALIIDQGRLHGLEPSMSVVAAGGVVGIIIEVEDLVSTVASLHHPECRIGAMVERNRLRAYDGVIHAWGSDLSLICTMEYIDRNREVRVGDRVVTSPESVFPAGYPIGVITRVISSDSLWKRAFIDPAVDPYRMDEVFIVRRATQGSQYLAQPQQQVAPADMPGREMPDRRSIQEQLAP